MFFSSYSSNRLAFHPPYLHSSSSICEPGIESVDGTFLVNRSNVHMWENPSFIRNSFDSAAKLKVKDSPTAAGCKRQGDDTTLPISYSLSKDDLNSKQMRRVCELCTKRKRKCENNGKQKRCLLCEKKNVPCRYQEKRRRGPKPKKRAAKQIDELSIKNRKYIRDSVRDAVAPTCFWGSVGRIPDFAVHDEGTVGLTDTYSNGYSGHLKPDNKAYGLRSGNCPPKCPTNSPHLAGAGTNLPYYPVDSSLIAPTDSVVIPGSYSSHTVSESKSDMNGSLQDEDGYTGGNVNLFSGLQMSGGSRASFKSFSEMSLSSMPSEPVPLRSSNSASPENESMLSLGVDETLPRDFSSQNQIAILLTNMSKQSATMGIGEVKDGGATDGK